MVKNSLRSLLSVFAAMVCVAVLSHDVREVYEIYPVPQEQRPVEGVCAFTPEVGVVAEDGIDAATRERVAQVLSDRGMKAVFVKKAAKGMASIYLGVNGSGGAADKMAAKRKLSRSIFSNNKFDRHIVSLGGVESGNSRLAQLLVLGENTDAVFYGLATLEQMPDKGCDNLPMVNIFDYADIKDRGVIEGYYGMPYSKEVTEDLLRFMMRHKMNSYMYGAKSDAYHSQYWDKPYPETLDDRQKSMGCFTASDMKHINAVSARTKVNFVWAIHPGTAFIGKDDNVISRIMGKFELMHQLGVRQFAVFVDDVGVPTDDATLALNAQRLTDLQNAMDRKWNAAATNAADTVKPLYFVPQLYAYSWEKPETVKRFYNALAKTPEKTQVYITGKAVWTVPNNNDLNVVEEHFGRDLAWWWNYPCNDNADAWVFPADMYSNFIDMPEIIDGSVMPKSLDRCISLLSNPMQQGEISKIPLFSVADFAWNNSEFNSRESWRASLPAVVGEEYARSLEALIPCLRVNDSPELEAAINAYKASGVGYGLKEILDGIVENCIRLAPMQYSSRRDQALFYNDIRPWLLKLRRTAEVALKLVGAAAGGGDKAALKAEAQALKTDPQYSVVVLEGMAGGIGRQTYNVQLGKNNLTPFVEYMLGRMK